jgi:predicted short-subunit dehydrogenase-like oxidoreductase (DUF2520 family)
MQMGKSISNEVRKITSHDRIALHVAAVFASNFTNHMLLLAKKTMQKNSLDYAWLEPLIIETINKSLSLGPENSQTGPAIRGDYETLDAHMSFLEDDTDKAHIYKIISQDIIDYHIED